jgi:PTS system nitrogen regulatory IIA component
MPYREFNLEEAADYLHIGPADLEDLAKQGLVPCRKVGGRFLFRKSEVERWMSRRVLGLKKGRLTEYHKKTSIRAHDVSQTRAFLCELMKPSGIEPRLSSRTKHSVIRDMVALADRTGLLNDADGLQHSIEAREKLASTALEGGVAMLHAEFQQPYMFEDSFVVLGRTVQAIPFGAPDGRTTDLFFLICCQDDRIHLPVLARLCMMCHQTSLLLELREAADAAAMYDALFTAEQEVVACL